MIKNIMAKDLRPLFEALKDIREFVSKNKHSNITVPVIGGFVRVFNYPENARDEKSYRYEILDEQMKVLSLPRKLFEDIN